MWEILSMYKIRKMYKEIINNWKIDKIKDIKCFALVNDRQNKTIKTTQNTTTNSKI